MASYAMGMIPLKEMNNHMQGRMGSAQMRLGGLASGMKRMSGGTAVCGKMSAPKKMK